MYSTLDVVYMYILCYNIITTASSTMNDYDYETVWDYEVSCHDTSYLEEETGYHGTYIDDEMDYERSDSTDYQNLAYIHFA